MSPPTNRVVYRFSVDGEEWFITHATDGTEQLPRTGEIVRIGERFYEIFEVIHTPEENLSNVYLTLIGSDELSERLPGDYTKNTDRNSVEEKIESTPDL